MCKDCANTEDTKNCQFLYQEYGKSYKSYEITALKHKNANMSDALPVKSQKGAANRRNDRAGKTEFEQFPGFPNKVHI